MFRFHDRIDAGRRLGERLAEIVPVPAVVAGIPRGGVVVAAAVAAALAAPLTVVHAVNLVLPEMPETPFGSVDQDGRQVLDPGAISLLGPDPSAIREATVRGLTGIRERDRRYRARALASFLPMRAVVLVADGLATGLAMRAAVRYARNHGARHITVAAPCGSEEVVRRLEAEADRVVVLMRDPVSTAVRSCYEDFPPVGDDEVALWLAPAEHAAPLAALS